MAIPFRWPQDYRTAISLTLDNMGEAADLNRGLWPPSQPVGNHYSVIEVLPKLLALFNKYNIYVTYFIESWNIAYYPAIIANDLASAGHEIAWHGWQHEKWTTLSGEPAERDNFGRSFGDQGLRGFTTGTGQGRGKVLPYYGFRPPGGRINGDRTLSLCAEHGLGYISPAAEHAAVVKVDRDDLRDSIIVLPFRWRAVDAYYYMESFSSLRKLKGEQVLPLKEEILVQRFTAEIDRAIEDRGYLSLVFHPFLANTPLRLQAMENVVRYLADKRDAGEVWLARCRDVAQHVRKNPRSVSETPEYDITESQ